MPIEEQDEHRHADPEIELGSQARDADPREPETLAFRRDRGAEIAVRHARPTGSAAIEAMELAQQERDHRQEQPDEEQAELVFDHGMPDRHEGDQPHEERQRRVGY